MFKKIFFLLILNLFFFQNVFSVELDIQEKDIVTQQKEIEPKNTLYIELKDGIVIAELFPTIAPRHVKRIKDLVKDGFYDGLKFHRVISGFMAQTGDPTGTGRGGSSYGKLVAEFNKENHTRGTLSMARSSNPDSANSQFFIVTGDYFQELDGQYTVFGRVFEGMEYVDNIKAGDTAKNGMVDDPDIMIKVLTGDMLNNKPLSVVKKEIEVIQEIQDEEAKKDKNYKRKSILKLLLLSKDIDSTNEEIIEEKKETTKTTEIKNEEVIKAKEIANDNSNINKEELKNSNEKTGIDTNNISTDGKLDNEKLKQETEKYKQQITDQVNSINKKNLLDVGYDLEKLQKEVKITDEEKSELEKSIRKIN